MDHRSQCGWTVLRSKITRKRFGTLSANIIKNPPQRVAGLAEGPGFGLPLKGAVLLKALQVKSDLICLKDMAEDLNVHDP